MFGHEHLTANLNLVIFKGSVQVYSYQTLVGFVTSKVYYKDEHKYSRTTTKHLTQIANMYGLRKPVIMLSQEQLQKVVQEHIHDCYREHYISDPYHGETV